LTDGGAEVKGNRGQFPRFTAEYCNLPSLCSSVNSHICLRFRLRAIRHVIVLTQVLRFAARKTGTKAAAAAHVAPPSAGTRAHNFR
jgi:hypothetical protein